MDKLDNPSDGKSWLVAIDGSPNGESALNFAIQRMDKKKDLLNLISVTPKVNSHLYTHAYVSMDFILKAQAQLEARQKEILRQHSKKAHDAHVENVHLMLSTSDSPGDIIVHAAEEKKVDFIVIGRRGMGAVKRFFLGSVSKFVLEHSPCDVMIVKGELGPEEEHANLAAIKKAEEVERQRRIKEQVQEQKDEDAKQKFESDLDRNVARLAEEKERMRRLQELENSQEQAQMERAASWKQVAEAEEAERQRRMEEDGVVEDRVHHVHLFQKKQ